MGSTCLNQNYYEGSLLLSIFFVFLSHSILDSFAILLLFSSQFCFHTPGSVCPFVNLCLFFLCVFLSLCICMSLGRSVCVSLLLPVSSSLPLWSNLAVSHLSLWWQSLISWVGIH